MILPPACLFLKTFCSYYLSFIFSKVSPLSFLWLLASVVSLFVFYIDKCFLFMYFECSFSLIFMVCDMHFFQYLL